mmetsp:Transcript_55695/g.129699  ORF Transcript_55695/g.129699 Transcript_55695/m.129699 type:complete len:346 (+) Transcript_55695:121-1158(+)
MMPDQDYVMQPSDMMDELGAMPEDPGLEPPEGERGERVIEPPEPPPPEAQECLNYPRNYFMSIIGPGGSTIKEIRRGGADVWIKPSEDHIEVFVAGTNDQVEMAKSMVQNVAKPKEDDPPKNNSNSWWDRSDWGERKNDRSGWWDRGGGEWNSSGGDWSERGGYDRGGRDRETETLKLEVSAFGCIVGPGGATIKDVRQQSGAHVSIDKMQDHVQVRISGNADQVAKAKELVTNLAGGGNPSAQMAEKSETLEFEKGVMGSIIGPGGKRINDVRKQSGADVSVRKVEDKCEVIIAGSTKAVEQAKVLVTNLVEASRQGPSGPPMTVEDAFPGAAVFQKKRPWGEE